MLDAYIIDELRRRERAKDKKEEADRPRLELPLHYEGDYPPEEGASNEDPPLTDGGGVRITL